MTVPSRNRRRRRRSRPSSFLARILGYKELLAAVGIIAALFFGIRAEIRSQRQEEIVIVVTGSHELHAPIKQFIADSFEEGACYGDAAGVITFDFTMHIDNTSQRPVSIRSVRATSILDGEPITWIRGLDEPGKSVQAGINGALALKTDPAVVVIPPFRLRDAESVDLVFELGWALGCDEIAALNSRVDSFYGVEYDLFSAGTSLGRAQISLSPGGGGLSFVVNMLESPRQLLKLEVETSSGTNHFSLFSFESNYER